MKLPFVFVVATCAIAAPVQDKIQDRFVPAPYQSQKVEGFLGERMHINLQQRLLKVDEAGLLDGFRKRPGTHAWIGEHIGKFLHAASNTWLYTHDEKLKVMMDRMAKELISTQLPDGYLGTYTDDQRWTSWDVWVHKYDLIGLLSYYDATSYQPALDASRKIGDLLVRTFGDEPGKRDIIAAGTHVGMASTSVLEPMAQLYRHTGDPKYLSFCNYLIRSWDQPNGPKILNTILQTGSVFKTANAKAYEMLSNIVGLLEMYRITGEPKFLKVAQLAFDDITTKRLYITGTASSHEHFTPDNHLPGLLADDVGEGCVTVTWLQLNWHLLRLTGEPKYADELERTVYNQLLGAQDPSTGNICYFTPLIGRKSATPGINCCVSSEPRGISMIPQLAWGTLGDGPAVLFYTPGRFQSDDVEVISQTNFPETGKVILFIEPKKKGKFPLQLRVPYWTQRFTAKVGGQEYTGKPGEFVTIERKWSRSDKVDIDMDMTVRELPGGLDYPDRIAVQRGPQVLVLDSGTNPSTEFLHAVALKSAKLTPAGVRKFTADGVVLARDGSRQDAKLTLVPFTEGVSYRSWLAKPETLPAGPINVAAYGKESSSTRSEGGSITDEKPDTVRTTRGRSKDQDDWFAVELNHPEEITRIVFRHGKSEGDKGWFETTPKVQVKRSGAAGWETVGELNDYKGPSLTDGQAFEMKLKAPTKAFAIRVIGRAAPGGVSCAELAAY